jgi:hypothetical protein
MLKFFFISLLFSFHSFAEIKLPNPKVNIDERLYEESRGNYPERRRLGIQYARDFNDAYSKEFSELYPDITNPFSNGELLQGITQFIEKEVTNETLDRPLSEFSGTMKRQFDKVALRPIMESLTLDELKMFVVEHEIRLLNISDGVIEPPKGKIPSIPLDGTARAETSSQPSAPASKKLPYENYAILGALALSVLNFILFFLKK